MGEQKPKTNLNQEIAKFKLMTRSEAEQGPLKVLVEGTKDMERKLFMGEMNGLILLIC